MRTLGLPTTYCGPICTEVVVLLDSFEQILLGGTPSLVHGGDSIAANISAIWMPPPVNLDNGPLPRRGSVVMMPRYSAEEPAPTCKAVVRTGELSKNGPMAQVILVASGDHRPWAFSTGRSRPSSMNDALF